LDIRKLIKSLLLIFIVLSFAFLIYKEFSPRRESNAINFAETQGDRPSVSEESMPVEEKQSAGEATGQLQERESSNKPKAKIHTSKVIAYYFHGTFRCTACRTIERYSQEAIEQYFTNELQNGTLEFRHVNVEEPENRHFIHDYQLFSRSLVISLVRQDKEITWKNLADVWKHLRDKEKFFRYVKNEVEQFLKETG
jgi:hypothetical protein